MEICTLPAATGPTPPMVFELAMMLGLTFGGCIALGLAGLLASIHWIRETKNNPAVPPGMQIVSAHPRLRLHRGPDGITLARLNPME